MNLQSLVSLMHEKILQNEHRLLKNIPNTHRFLDEQYPSKIEAPYEVILVFVDSLDMMKQTVLQAEKELTNEGILYLCYPKLKNTLSLIGIHRDHIFPYLQVDQTTGYVKDTLMRFNKMAAFDDNYTLLAVKKDTKQKSRPQTSQKVEDYEVYIEHIKELLKNESCYDFYNNLTRGYQKGWARYIYSAKTEGTKQKRLKKMIELLSKGIKSKDLA